MSRENVLSIQHNFVHRGYDLRKIFVFRNEYESASFRNNLPTTQTFLPGTLLAEDPATGELIPLDSTLAGAAEARTPVGVLAQKIENIATTVVVENISFCVRGDVASELLIFQGTDTLSTLTAGYRIGGWLRRIGIRVVDSIDLKLTDNN